MCPKVVDEGRGLKAPLWLDVRFTVGVRVRLRLDFLRFRLHNILVYFTLILDNSVEEAQGYPRP